MGNNPIFFIIYIDFFIFTVYTVCVICRKVGDCMNGDYEPMLNENVSQETDVVSEIPISDVRELYKDDERFNPVTVYRLVKMFDKLVFKDFS